MSEPLSNDQNIKHTTMEMTMTTIDSTDEQKYVIGERAMCASRNGKGTRECIIREGLASREVEPGQYGLAYIVEIPGVRSYAFDGCWNVYPWQLSKVPT